MSGNLARIEPEKGKEANSGNAATAVREIATRTNVAAPKAPVQTVTRRSSSKLRRKAVRSPVQTKIEPKRRSHLVPKHWHNAALLSLLSFPLCVALTLEFPPTAVIIAAVLVLCSAALARCVSVRDRLNEQPSLALRIGGWTAIMAPPALQGFMMAVWVTQSTLGWVWGISSLVAVFMMCASMLLTRPLQQFVVQLGAWGSVVAVIRTPEAIAALCVGCFFVALIARYHAIVHRNFTEISEAKERKRNRAEDILRDYEDTGQGWFWESDRRGLITYLSPSILNVLNRPESEIIGRPFIELFDLGDENCEGERTLNFHLSARSSFVELGVRAATPGEERWWSINGRPAYDTYQNFVGFRGSGTDLTEKKRSQENVNRLAQYDSLTSLANRFQMNQLLEKILNAPQEQHRECSVFLLDLDRFKQVNDTLGHPAGDALLKQVAQRLETTVAKDGRVGRLGGDEFKVIVPGRTSREKLAQLAQTIIHSLSQPYLIEGQRVVIGASIGIAVSPADGVSSESIIRNADLALYAAKDGGRGRLHFYSNDLHSAAEERSLLEQDLRDAIANGGLDLFYQPIVNANSNVISGFEALLRWNHPKRGWLSPAKFIPIAEDTGLINAIGEWAIRTACDDLADWPDSIRCAVNVSPLQFSNPQLPSIITNAIARADIHPSRLELEITESVFLNDDAGTDAMFTALKRVGVRLALDDFGTGYSSLGYLKKAPFDKIKIDQSFVRGATEAGSRNGAIITSITGLAKSLGMDTTAEGVETLDELDLVRSLGCSHVQGYIYSKAVNSQTASSLLRSGLRLEPSGPRSSREARPTMFRKIMLENGGQFYPGTIRNMSSEGAMIEGLWNVPEGTAFQLALSKTLIVPAVTVWNDQDKMGVKFKRKINLENLEVAQGPAPFARPDANRKSA